MNNKDTTDRVIWFGGFLTGLTESMPNGQRSVEAFFTEKLRKNIIEFGMYRRIKGKL